MDHYIVYHNAQEMGHGFRSTQHPPAMCCSPSKSSDSTLKFDREKKLPKYARSSIPETWILNLNEAQLEVYTQPKGEQYLKMQIFKPEMAVAPLFAPEITLEWWAAHPM